ncbi:hypothetical protein [Mucilaginibacter sp. 22184]|uniref:hypothetical protein n=1 Tax=Mucilaginibacter sp. 22184 TaxID=3453887 RepID=UPI003F8455B6
MPTTPNPISGSINTIADLTNYPGTTDKQTIELLGYYAVNDGGGGEFYWDSLSTETQDGGTIIQTTAATGRWKRIVTDVINANWFGAIPGSTDYTGNITKALTYCNVKTKSLRFPAGSYMYSGSGFNFNNPRLFISGDGAGVTTISISTSSYFIDTAGGKTDMLIENITFSGGLGAFRSTFPGSNGSNLKAFRFCNFFEYTECAIQSNGTDEPYWRISNCVFKASANSADPLNPINPIGVAIGNNADKTIIEGCNFLSNRIHIKIRGGGISSNIWGNDFIQFTGGDGKSRMSVWIVPNANATVPGTGLFIEGNKFGNENQSSIDYRIVYADELSGTYNGDRLPNLQNASSGYITGHLIKSNKVSGSVSISFIYTTTTNVRLCTISQNVFDGISPSFLLNFLNAPTPNYSNQGNLFEDNTGLDYGILTMPLNISNGLGVGILTDSLSQYDGNPVNIHTYTGGGQDYAGFVQLYSSITTGALSVNGGTTIVGSLTDATGGTEARQYNIPGGSFALGYLSNSSVIKGSPSWIEFDLVKAGATPLQNIVVQIQYNGGAVHFQRICMVPDSWQRFRFPFVFRDNAVQLNVNFAGLNSSSGTVAIGRVRVYHAREPIAFGRLKFEQFDLSLLPTSATGLNPGSIWVDTANGNVLKRV